MEFHLSVESPLAHKGCWSCPFLPCPVWSGCSWGLAFYSGHGYREASVSGDNRDPAPGSKGEAQIRLAPLRCCWKPLAYLTRESGQCGMSSAREARPHLPGSQLAALRLLCSQVPPHVWNRYGISLSKCRKGLHPGLKGSEGGWPWVLEAFPGLMWGGRRLGALALPLPSCAH